ncbi:MAG: hypothetical protein NC408_04425 [Candidatus Gastranaerophilales bacterium]|nr:hypothetical protein [Candidatus Gastranaerophilales bacterium]MCM1072283.1 hypothetical protein [Bacteroides sp.]
MDRDDLVLLRNYLQQSEGKLLVNFLSNYITENACRQREASEIKGMCELLHQIKTMPNKVAN